MATSAFKSTSRRAPFGGSDEVSAAGSSSSSSSSANRAHRRSRSLSRFSRRLPFDEEPAAAASYGVEATPRRKFVNTVRGSEFPEISLDDLAIELFSQRDEDRGSSDHDRSRSARRGSEIGRWASETASSQRRGRSVSRQSSKTSGDRKSVVSDRSRVNTGLPESNSRRRRSVSVVRYQISDSESDADHSRKQANLITMKSLGNGKNDIPSHKATAANGSGLRRPLNQKDLLRLQDGYSSHSSVLTDDEIKDHPCKNGNEKTIQAVYSQKKGIIRKNGNHYPLDSSVRSSYATKLEESEKRKQDLLAEILLEDQKGRELSRIVKELLPDTNKSTAGIKQSRTRKKSNDRGRMSKQLTVEAEKYLEDFISNVEDTDISSFDGERSDGSSTLGGIIKARDSVVCAETESYHIPVGSDFRPVEMDGVKLPWLKWETSNDGSNKTEIKTPPSQKSVIWDAKQETVLEYDQSCYSNSSQGSYSPGITKYHEMIKLHRSGGEEDNNCDYEVCPRFDMQEYLRLQQSEELLFERYRERERISSGGLLTCCTHAFSSLIF
ncbi:PREDICTED: uncharacterized protein LOC109192575 isoform X2 [Ipomoea nil]|uniref:uncharacterized protein LOC109192575 isoform X2 n=1 Tax=Ipomoea nil TaxID=35883 RepID=UPI000901E4F1|nr:PREDICTED: uncharacterized protein LOC109192575 isoform X2 [Ipomoea nil]